MIPHTCDIHSMDYVLQVFSQYRMLHHLRNQLLGDGKVEAERSDIGLPFSEWWEPSLGSTRRFETGNGYVPDHLDCTSTVPDVSV